MSADAWETCPLCKSQKETIREDIEYGVMEDGKAFVNLRMECVSCGARWKIEVRGVRHSE